MHCVKYYISMRRPMRGCRFQDFQIANLCHNFYVKYENLKINQHLFNKSVVKINKNVNN